MVVVVVMIMTYAWPPGNLRRHQPLKIAAPAKQGFPHHRKYYKDDTGPRYAHGFQPSSCI